ncbi:hypothetical protein IFM89_005492 [Coptis chinensis]|uniref:Uncharacterized protein n=1 Tax=Coptis chinensis TaxID=261450 RepID=A0A835LYJ9_9MAGN|nr:hypothetical protein IFM89_005492 [Coptis chinensis]
MCTVVIVDPYSLDIVRTVFHGSLSIGELKFMAAIPSGKYIIYDIMTDLQKLKEKASFRNLDEFYFGFWLVVQKLKEKASFRNSDEFYYKMIKSKTKIEKLNSMLHSLDNQLTNKHIYYAEDSTSVMLGTDDMRSDGPSRL